MSFSKQKLPNPATKFIEFKADRGVYQYYDKEKEKNIELETPAYFIVLDELTTIKGFSDKHKSSIYSNEVHYLKDEILNVRSFKGGVSIVGRYSEIKDKIKAAGGRFAKSIYCLHLVKDKEPEMVNLQLFGAAFSAWFDFKFSQTANIICLTGETHKEKKGATTYHVPHFSKMSIDERFIQKAIDEDVKLQEYFKQYKNDTTEPEEKEYTEEKTGAEVFHETNYEQDKQGNTVHYPEDIEYPPMGAEDIPPELDDDTDLPF